MPETTHQPRVSLIAALSKQTRAIGRDNQLLWHLPGDLKRFKTLTAGHSVIMGRKTFESILDVLGRPLPDRHSIVVTHQSNYDHDGIDVVSSLEAALEKARGDGQEEIFVIGGQQIYEQALTFADRLYLTLVDSDKPGDTHFPPYEETFTKELAREEQNESGLHYTWLTLERS